MRRNNNRRNRQNNSYVDKEFHNDEELFEQYDDLTGDSSDKSQSSSNDRPKTDRNFSFDGLSSILNGYSNSTTNGGRKRFSVDEVYNLDDDMFQKATRVYGKHPGMAQLEVAVNRMDAGEKYIKKIEKMNSSIVHKSGAVVQDNLRKFFNLPAVERDIYKIFRQHQSDVKDINYIVLSMTRNYERNLDEITDLMHGIYDTEAEINEFRKNIDTSFLEVDEEYKFAVEYLESIDRFENPEEFKEARIRYQEARSAKRKFGFDDRCSSLMEIGYNYRIGILETQKEIFEELLYTVKELGIKTGIYQRILNDFAVACEPTRNLAEAVSMLTGSVSALEDVKNSVMGRYKQDISSIILKASHTDIGQRAIENNQVLKQLSSDINSATYSRAVKYDENRMELYGN